MHTNVAIVGSGGHAKVVIDTVLALNNLVGIRVFDDNPCRAGELLLRKFVVSCSMSEVFNHEYYHIAVGHNKTRESLAGRYVGRNKAFLTIIHPKAIVSSFAVLADGVLVAPNAVIAAESAIGQGAIINHSAVVDHECNIGEFAHVAPNVTLGGGVLLGARCFVGAGAVILPGVRLGCDVTVGAGAVVTRDIIDGQVVKGIPARCFQ